MSKYYNRSNLPDTIPAPAGDKYHIDYVETLDDSGRTILKEAGRTDIDAEIQAALPSTLIYNILARADNGDTTALAKTIGTYADYLDAPQTLADAHRLIKDAKEAFAQLPIDIRREYNHDAGQYITALSDGRFNSFLERRSKNDAAPKIEKKEVTENEQK